MSKDPQTYQGAGNLVQVRVLLQGIIAVEGKHIFTSVHRYGAMAATRLCRNERRRPWRLNVAAQAKQMLRKGVCLAWQQRQTGAELQQAK